MKSNKFFWLSFKKYSISKHFYPIYLFLEIQVINSYQIRFQVELLKSKKHQGRIEAWLWQSCLHLNLKNCEIRLDFLGNFRKYFWFLNIIIFIENKGHQKLNLCLIKHLGWNKLHQLQDKPVWYLITKYTYINLFLDTILQFHLLNA